MALAFLEALAFLVAVAFQEKGVHEGSQEEVLRNQEAQNHQVAHEEGNLGAQTPLVGHEEIQVEQSPSVARHVQLAGRLVPTEHNAVKNVCTGFIWRKTEGSIASLWDTNLLPILLVVLPVLKSVVVLSSPLL